MRLCGWPFGGESGLRSPQCPARQVTPTGRGHAEGALPASDLHADTVRTAVVLGGRKEVVGGGGGERLGEITAQAVQVLEVSVISGKWRSVLVSWSHLPPAPPQRRQLACNVSSWSFSSRDPRTTAVPTHAGRRRSLRGTEGTQPPCRSQWGWAGGDTEVWPPPHREAQAGPPRHSAPEAVGGAPRLLEAQTETPGQHVTALPVQGHSPYICDPQQ